MSTAPEKPDASLSQVTLPKTLEELQVENEKLLNQNAHENTAKQRSEQTISQISKRLRLVVQLESAAQYLKYDLLRAELEKMAQLTQEQMTELVRDIVDIMDPSVPPENKPDNEVATQIIGNIHVQPIADYVPSRTPDPTDRVGRSYFPEHKKWDDDKERLHPHEPDEDDM